MNLITQHTERYAVPHNTVSDRTLFNALLNRHGATARHGKGKNCSALVLSYGLASLVLCRSRTCRSNKQIFWVNEVNGITSWTDLFLSHFSQEWNCSDSLVNLWQTTQPACGQGLTRLHTENCRWFSFTYCTESGAVSLTHSVHRSWFTFSNRTAKISSVLLTSV